MTRIIAVCGDETKREWLEKQSLPTLNVTYWHPWKGIKRPQLVDLFVLSAIHFGARDEPLTYKRLTEDSAGKIHGIPISIDEIDQLLDTTLEIGDMIERGTHYVAIMIDDIGSFYEQCLLDVDGFGVEGEKRKCQVHVEITELFLQILQSMSIILITEGDKGYLRLPPPVDRFFDSRRGDCVIDVHENQTKLNIHELLQLPQRIV